MLSYSRINFVFFYFFLLSYSRFFRCAFLFCLMSISHASRITRFPSVVVMFVVGSLKTRPAVCRSGKETDTRKRREDGRNEEDKIGRRLHRKMWMEFPALVYRLSSVLAAFFLSPTPNGMCVSRRRVPVCASRPHAVEVVVEYNACAQW